MHDDRAITHLPATTVLARIAGRVQGVGYRAWVRRRGEKLGLSGWVRNRTDGTVEALLHGTPASVDAMVDACRKGPPLARVDDIVVTSAEPPPHVDFRKLPTV